MPALILGLLCVAEGGLPLLLSDLLFMIPINCLGGGLAAASAYLFGVHAENLCPGGILGVPLLEKPFLYMLSILIGRADRCGAGSAAEDASGSKAMKQKEA